MSEHVAVSTRFLSNTPWANWHSKPIAQDASARTYQRLSDGKNNVIFMIAPPETCGSSQPFVDITNALRQRDLAAPAVLAADMSAGLLILEDLGPTDFASHISEHPEDEKALYTAATDVLIHLSRQTAPDLSKMTPDIGGDMVRICAEHYVDNPSLADDLAGVVTQILGEHCGPADVFALRDFHAENLIWRPTLEGFSRVGLLDFQDAFLAPNGYDLASLLFDARRDVPTDVAAAMIDRFAEEMHVSNSDMTVAIACLSAQRNLRILGVFGRLIRVHNKPRYAGMLPRVWAHVMRNAEHPALRELRSLVCTGIPHPDSQQIAKWTA